MWFRYVVFEREAREFCTHLSSNTYEQSLFLSLTSYQYTLEYYEISFVFYSPRSFKPFNIVKPRTHQHQRSYTGTLRRIVSRVFFPRYCLRHIDSGVRVVRACCSSAKRENFNHIPQISLYHSSMLLHTQELRNI